MTSILFLLTTFAFAQDGGLPAPAPAKTTTTTTTTVTPTAPVPVADTAADLAEELKQCKTDDPCIEAILARITALEAPKPPVKTPRTDALCLEVFGNKGCKKLPPPAPPVAPPPTQVVVTPVPEIVPPVLITPPAVVTPELPPAPPVADPIVLPPPVFSTVVEEESPLRLGAYVGFAGSQHREIPGVTAPGMMSANAGVKLHVDGQHGFMSVQAGALTGTDATTGWEGKLSVGADVGGLELGLTTGFYQYEITGLGSATPQYAKAKGYGSSVGLSLAGSPSKAADWLSLGVYAQVSPWGRVLNSETIISDSAPTIGVSLDAYMRGRKTQREVTVVTGSSTPAVRDPMMPTPFHP